MRGKLSLVLSLWLCCRAMDYLIKCMRQSRWQNASFVCVAISPKYVQVHSKADSRPPSFQNPYELQRACTLGSAGDFWYPWNYFSDFGPVDIVIGGNLLHMFLWLHMRQCGLVDSCCHAIAQQESAQVTMLANLMHFCLWVSSWCCPHSLYQIPLRKLFLLRSCLIIYVI